MIHDTRRGRSLSGTIPVAREARLDSAINGLLDDKEQQTLLNAAAIMTRIADSDGGSR
jgi:hypothetical protein